MMNSAMNNSDQWGCLIKIAQKRKKRQLFTVKGIELPLALLYNLIATKNPQESEIIIQQ